MFRPLKGFTLIEAMVVMAIAVILLMIAIPAWSHARAAANASAVRAELATSLLKAVSYSANAGAEVVVCPASILDQCTDSIDWDSGWLAFADANGNRVRDPIETLIVRTSAIGKSVHLQSTSGRTRLVFQPSGGNAGSNVTFTLCDSRGIEYATALILSNMGTLRNGTPPRDAAQRCVYGQ
jgi:type IV fimbrial biogenesis protein FimT